MIITHNKKQNLLLDLLSHCISAWSAPQILPLKDEYTFRSSNSLILDLCNSSANFIINIRFILRI